jgi:hypothetical protein
LISEVERACVKCLCEQGVKERVKVRRVGENCMKLSLITLNFHEIIKE